MSSDDLVAISLHLEVCVILFYCIVSMYLNKHAYGSKFHRISRVTGFFTPVTAFSTYNLVHRYFLIHSKYTLVLCDKVLIGDIMKHDKLTARLRALFWQRFSASWLPRH
jgi:hypothetical protein